MTKIEEVEKLMSEIAVELNVPQSTVLKLVQLMRYVKTGK